MGVLEDYESKLEILTAIEKHKIKIPHHIPVDVYIQEADSLYHWCRVDKEPLTGAGLSWELVEDLPVRIGALVEAEARWNVERNTRKESEKKWTEQSPIAYDLRDRILTDFRLAFRKSPDLLAGVRRIAKGHTHANMIQGLNDLSVLGGGNRELLTAIRFDMSLLDRAAQASGDLASLLGETTRCREEYDGSKRIRDQAYTHLKEGVDEICVHGKHVFRRDKERFHGYRSNYVRRTRKKSAPKPDAPEAEKS